MSQYNKHHTTKKCFVWYLCTRCFVSEISPIHWAHSFNDRYVNNSRKHRTFALSIQYSMCTLKNNRTDDINNKYPRGP